VHCASATSSTLATHQASAIYIHISTSLPASGVVLLNSQLLAGHAECKLTHPRGKGTMTKPLSLSSVIGFAGQVPEGLLCLDGQTLVYALGSTIVLRDKDDARMQEFLQGHTDKVHQCISAPCAPHR
jgi:hypothetical protein